MNRIVNVHRLSTKLRESPCSNSSLVRHLFPIAGPVKSSYSCEAFLKRTSLSPSDPKTEKAKRLGPRWSAAAFLIATCEGFIRLDQGSLYLAARFERSRRDAIISAA
jgi:hypothetical protein